MSKTTAKHYRAGLGHAKRDKRIPCPRKTTFELGPCEMRIGGRVAGRTGKVTIDVEARAMEDLKRLSWEDMARLRERVRWDVRELAVADYTEIEQRILATHYDKERPSLSRYYGLSDDGHLEERKRRPPKQKPKVAPFPSNLDMAQFNAPENLARWAAQCVKVMGGTY